MNDWKKQLKTISNNNSTRPSAIVITIPNHFIFKNHGVYIFEPIIGFFDWSICNKQVTINFTKCKTANYQALALVVLYCWRLKSQGCRITFDLDKEGASLIWRKMGGFRFISCFYR